MRVFDDDGVRSRSDEPGVFAFSFSRLRRTTAKPVREESRHLRGRHVWNGHEVNARRRKRVRIARSRPRAWGGIERRSPRRAVRRERDLRFRDRRASLFRDAPSRTTRTEVVAHVARPSHAENGQVTAQVARVAQLAALQARLEHRKPFARKDAFTKRDGRSTSRRRTARVRPKAWEAREALPRPVRHGTRIYRPTPFAPRATTANERLETWSRTCMGKQCESCTARTFVFSREPAVGASRGKKSACTSASHQGTRSAARGFRPAAPGSAPFVPTRVPFASPAGRVSSAPRASGASVGRRRPNAHRAHRRRRRPDAARRR